MADWEHLWDMAAANVRLKNYMFEYLFENGHFSNNEPISDSKWFFDASIGNTDSENSGHRKNAQIFCESFLPEYRRLLNQQETKEKKENGSNGGLEAAI